jgi:hypothetical protein
MTSIELVWCRSVNPAPSLPRDASNGDARSISARLEEFELFRIGEVEPQFVAPVSGSNSVEEPTHIKSCQIQS